MQTADQTPEPRRERTKSSPDLSYITRGGSRACALYRVALLVPSRATWSSLGNVVSEQSGPWRSSGCQVRSSPAPFPYSRGHRGSSASPPCRASHAPGRPTGSPSSGAGRGLRRPWAPLTRPPQSPPLSRARPSQPAPPPGGAEAAPAGPPAPAGPEGGDVGRATRPGPVVRSRGLLHLHLLLQLHRFSSSSSPPPGPSLRPESARGKETESARRRAGPRTCLGQFPSTGRGGRSCEKSSRSRVSDPRPRTYFCPPRPPAPAPLRRRFSPAPASALGAPYPPQHPRRLLSTPPSPKRPVAPHWPPQSPITPSAPPSPPLPPASSASSASHLRLCRHFLPRPPLSSSCALTCHRLLHPQHLDSSFLFPAPPAQRGSARPS